MNPPTALPEDLRLLTEHPADLAFPAVARAFLDSALPGASLSGWRLAGQPTPSVEGPAALERLLEGNLSGVDQGFLELSFESGLKAVAALEGGGWVIDAMCFADRGEAAMARWLAHAIDLARRLVPALPTLAAQVVRSPSAGGFFIPEPPIARMRHVWMSSDAEIAECYGGHAGWFERAWDEVLGFADHKLLVRAADKIAEPDWIAAVLDNQMQMARRTVIDETRWHRAVLTEWNRRWLMAPQDYLSFVGYDPATRRIEFTAMTQGCGLSIGELQMLFELRSAGRDGKGRPVSQVDVVYLDAAAAAPDRVPLRDLGIRALCYGPDGGLEPLA